MEEIDYKTLLGISQSTAAVRTRQELQALIENKIQPCFGFNKFWNVRIYDSNQNILELFLNGFEPELAKNIPAFKQPFKAEGIFRTIIETSEIVCTDESWKSSPKIAEIDKMLERAWRKFNLKYSLSIALRSFGNVIGTFQAMFDEKRTFNPSQLQLFKSLADQIAIALVNVLANEKVLEREQEKASLLSVSEEMAKIRDRADLRRVLAEKIKPLINFNDAVIILLSEDRAQYSRLLVASSEDQISLGPSSPAICKMLPLGGTPYEYLLTLANPRIVDVADLSARYSDYSDAFLNPEKKLSNLVVFHLQWGNRLRGLFLLAAKNKEQVSEAKLGLYKAIANQIAVAVGTILTNEEVAQLAEELRRRAEELAKSNEAMVRTSERLSALPDLSAFLGQVTIEAAKQLNANSGILLTSDEKEKTFQPRALFEKGELFINEDIPAWATYEDAPIWRELQGIRRPRQFDLAADNDLFCESFIKYHHERSHKRLLVVPLLAANKPLGCMGLSFLEAAPIDAQRTELVATLAHQATLAIQLTRYADEAEQAAIVQEKEKAARARAESLANTDQALKNSFEKLAEPDLNEILSHILCEIVGQLQVSNGCFWLYQADEKSFTPQMYVTASETCLIADMPPAEMGISAQPFSAADLPIWEKLLKTRQPIVTTREDSEQAAFRGTAELKLAHYDLQSTVTVPFIIGDEPLAVLSLVSEEKQTFGEAELELVRRLAAHAALAIKLTRLADKARCEAEQTAALDERNRIAREIHDTLAQGFTGVILQLETAKRIFGKTTPRKVSEYVSRSIELAREGLAQARQSVQALRPSAQDLQLDLPLLLREKLIALTADTGIETEFSTMGTPIQFSPDAMLNLLRIGQEAIVNALRHSEAKRIIVKLDYSDGVRLRVADDGIGFETSDKGKSEGYGLRGMSERAAAIKAELNTQSKSGGGTSVTVSLKNYS